MPAPNKRFGEIGG